MKQLKLLLLLMVIGLSAYSQGTTPPATQQSISPAWFRTNATDSNFYGRVGINTWYRFPTWEKVNSIFGNYYSKTVSDARFAKLSGGNSFTGSQIINGALSASSAMINNGSLVVTNTSDANVIIVTSVTGATDKFATISSANSIKIASNNNILIQGTSVGLVGIGTESPVEKLDVTGKARVSVAPTNPTDVVRKTELDLKQDILVSGTNIKTINGSSIVGSGNVTISSGGSGTVTSVGMTVPTGLTVTGSPITTAGTLAVSLQTGYTIPTTASLSSYELITNKQNSLATDGSGIKYPTVDAVNTVLATKQASLSGTGFIKATGTTISYDNSTYATQSYADAKVQNSLTASTTIAPSSTAVNTGLALKQDLLVSNTNIKTVGGTSILGSGNIPVGTGTVTSFGKTDGYGITSSVANSTTTPVLTIAADTTVMVTKSNLSTTRPIYWKSVINSQTPSGTFLTPTKTFGEAIDVTGIRTTSLWAGYNAISASTYTVGINDYTIVATAATTITLDAPLSGKIYVIKNLIAAGGVVGIVPTSGTIDGKTNLSLGVYGDVVSVQWNGTNYVLLNSTPGLPEKSISTSASFTLVRDDFGINQALIIYANAASASVNINFNNATLAASLFGNRILRVIKTDSSANTVTVTGTQNINGATTYTLTGQYNSVEIHSNNTQYYAR